MLTDGQMEGIPITPLQLRRGGLMKRVSYPENCKFDKKLDLSNKLKIVIHSSPFKTSTDEENEALFLKVQDYIFKSKRFVN